MNNNIKKSIDNLLTIVDEFKTDIKENDYIKVMDELKIINDNNKNPKLYELTFLKFSSHYRSRTINYENELTINETIMPTIDMVKQRFLLTETEVVELIIKIDELVVGLNPNKVYGLTPNITNIISKKVGKFMYGLESGERTRDNEYNIGDDEIRIYKDIQKQIRLINIRDIESIISPSIHGGRVRRRRRPVRRLAQMSDDDDDDDESEEIEPDEN